MADTIDTVLFIDSLKQVIQTNKEVSVATSGGNPENKMTVSGQVVFDALGKTVQQHHPETEGLGSYGTLNQIANPKFNQSYFDILGRPIRTILPDGATTRMAYGFAMQGGSKRMRTTITDAESKVKKSYKDVRGLITAMEEKLGNQSIWTRYKYDGLKQITEVQDAKNNLTTVKYDMLGRRTEIRNPDAGVTQMKYDLASNLTEKLTSNLMSGNDTPILYEYEFNRLKKTSYPNYPENNVTYTYGGPKSPYNQAGRLVKVEHGSGSEERQYGKLGEVLSSIKTFQKKNVTLGKTGKPTKPQVYKTDYVFDTFGRLITLTLPDKEVVTHKYDAGGNVIQIWGMKDSRRFDYLKRMEYDKFEQRVLVEYGNGVVSTYSYDDNQRILNLVSMGGDSRKFQDFNYSYDQVGNVTQLMNNLVVPESSYKFGGESIQNFEYDDLHRLVKADGKYRSTNTEEHTYSLSMEYNEIHNIISKNQVHQSGLVDGILKTRKRQPITSLMSIKAPSHMRRPASGIKIIPTIKTGIKQVG